MSVSFPAPMESVKRCRRRAAENWSCSWKALIEVFLWGHTRHFQWQILNYPFLIIIDKWLQWNSPMAKTSKASRRVWKNVKMQDKVDILEILCFSFTKAWIYIKKKACQGLTKSLFGKSADSKSFRMRMIIIMKWSLSCASQYPGSHVSLQHSMRHKDNKKTQERRVLSEFYQYRELTDITKTNGFFFFSVK